MPTIRISKIILISEEAICNLGQPQIPIVQFFLKYI
jgi:hypothetical protein